MKNNLVILACISSAFLSGMDKPQTELPLYVFNGTVICLTKGSMYEIDGAVDLMVVGRNEQRKLQKPSFGDCSRVGRIYEVNQNTVYIMNQGTDSASDDDTIYRPFDTSSKQELWKNAHSKQLETNVIAIIEPRIMFECFKDNTEANEYGYFVQKKHPIKKNCFCNEEHYGEDAITHAKEDLVICYTKVLVEGAKKIADKENKSIGLPALGTDVGFPRKEAAPVAVATILEFIKNNRDAYDLVHLFVKKRSEFVLYKELLDEHIAAKVE